MSNAVLTIQVKNQLGDVMSFKMKNDHELGKMFTAYEYHSAHNVEQFFFNGKQISKTDTPEMLNLKENDQIECVVTFSSDIIIFSVNMTKFKMKRTSKLGRMFKAYAQRKSELIHHLPYKDLTFLFNGKHVMETDTPELLQLENGDHIECFFPTWLPLLEELNDICGSDLLSLDDVRDKLNPTFYDNNNRYAILEEDEVTIPPRVVHHSPFFHRACMNEKVTLEIVKCLLDYFPDAGSASAEFYQSEEGGPLPVSCKEFRST